MKNFKLHAIVLVLIIIAEMIGVHSFKVGVGTIVLLPMLFALLLGVLTTPKFLKISGKAEMLDASSLLGLTLMLLMTTILLFLKRYKIRFFMRLKSKKI